MSNPIKSMPGVAQLSPDMAVREAREIAAAGVPAVILFGLPEHKDAIGSEAWERFGIRAARDRGNQGARARRWS